MFKSQFITIDHADRVSEKQNNIELAKSVLDIPSKKASSQTITIKRAKVEEFNRAILKLYDNYMIALSGKKYNPDLKVAADLCLRYDTVADTNCKNVSDSIRNLVQAYPESTIENNSNRKTIYAAKDIMNYLNESFLPHVIKYFSDIKASKPLDEEYAYKDAFKNYTMIDYVHAINKLDTNSYFNGSTPSENNRYEYLLMIDYIGLTELCLAWCKQYKIELQIPSDKLSTIITNIINSCYTSSHQHKNEFGHYLYNQYLPNGEFAKEQDETSCSIVIVAYDTASKQYCFKTIQSKK